MHVDMVCFNSSVSMWILTTCLGDTQTSNDTDYSLNTLSDDLVNVIQALYDGQDTPDLILVGHR